MLMTVFPHVHMCICVYVSQASLSCMVASLCIRVGRAEGSFHRTRHTGEEVCVDADVDV